MALTDTTIRNLKPRQTPLKKSDGGGLYLLIMPEGSKLWRLAYRFADKQKSIALGSYPVVTLAMAREARNESKRLLAQGVDPSEKRKADKRAAAAARTSTLRTARHCGANIPLAVVRFSIAPSSRRVRLVLVDALASLIAPDRKQR